MTFGTNCIDSFDIVLQSYKRRVFCFESIVGPALLSRAAAESTKQERQKKNDKLCEILCPATAQVLVGLFIPCKLEYYYTKMKRFNQLLRW